jgi:hypothetical protein
MTKRYERPTIGGWLRPALIGPWLSVYGAVTAIAALGIDRGLFGKVVGWAVGMVVGSAWALVFILAAALVDLLLLGVRVRTLPAGRRAWSMSLLSPLATIGIYMAVPPHTFIKYGPWGVVAAILAPMFAVLIAFRVAAGQKPLR